MFSVYDFTKFWRPGQTSHFTPTYLTTPTGTPVLSTQGYLTNNNNLDTFPQRGLFTLAGLGLTSSTDVHNNAILSGSPAKPSSHVIEKIGVFPINPKADEYVTPTPYAPDVFDTDDTKEIIYKSVTNATRDMVREWLDQNLPYLIERLVKKEIDHMVNRAERLDL